MKQFIQRVLLWYCWLKKKGKKDQQTSKTTETIGWTQYLFYHKLVLEKGMGKRKQNERNKKTYCRFFCFFLFLFL